MKHGLYSNLGNMQQNKKKHIASFIISLNEQTNGQGSPVYSLFEGVYFLSLTTFCTLYMHCKYIKSTLSIIKLYFKHFTPFLNLNTLGLVIFYTWKDSFHSIMDIRGIMKLIKEMRRKLNHDTLLAKTKHIKKYLKFYTNYTCHRGYIYILTLDQRKYKLTERK